MSASNLLLLLRPIQWLKNLFIFLPLFFDRHLFDTEFIIPSVITFIAFCFAASGVYCFNDIIDAEADCRHPTKCKRPIASGVVSKPAAIAMMMVCFIISLQIISSGYMLGDKVNSKLIGIITVYIMMNMAYCIKLKKLAIIDVFVIAIGFVLRVFAGGAATGIHLTHWIILMTFLLALFIAFAKRRDDVVMYEDFGEEMRESVKLYNLTFMNQVIAVVASITMICYIMYSVSPEVIERFQSDSVYLTSIFVLAGIIRYLQMTVVDVKSGDPTLVFLNDRFIQCCLVCWILSFIIILYF